MAVNNGTGKKRLGRLVKLLTVLGMIMVMLLVFHGTCRIEKMEITGNDHYEDNEIVDLLIQDRLDVYAPLLYLKHKLSTHETYPFIEYIDLELTGTDSVKVYVYEKTVCGCIEVMGRYMYFDKDGIVVASLPERSEGIPLVTGLTFSKIVLNEKLEVQGTDIFDDMLDIALLIRKNNIAADKLHIGADYRFTLYCGQKEVILGRRKSYDEPINALPKLFASSGDKALEYDMEDYSIESPEVIARRISSLGD